MIALWLVNSMVLVVYYFMTILPSYSISQLRDFFMKVGGKSKIKIAVSKYHKIIITSCRVMCVLAENSKTSTDPHTSHMSNKSVTNPTILPDFFHIPVVFIDA